MNAAEITDKLGLHNLRQRKWHTQVSNYHQFIGKLNPSRLDLTRFSRQLARPQETVFTKVWTGSPLSFKTPDKLFRKK